ncbi:MAG TPA: hypothetical protein VGM90_20170 [Kofleriaceae bacterium]|jgi:hypothetical protein
MRWIALFLLVGCGKVEKGQPDAPPIDDAPPDQLGSDAGLGPWGTPMPITELNSTAADQDPAFTGDLLEIVFSSGRTGGSGGPDLWTATRTSAAAAWGAPVNLSNLNSATNDDRPWISADGLRMYFTSDRGGNGNDIYVTARASRTTPWAAPSLVPELMSVSDDEVGGLSEDELAIVFSTDRGGVATGRDLYLARRTTRTGSFGVPQPIVELDTSAVEGAAAFAGHDAALYFVRASQLWVAERSGTTYTNPHLIDELVDTVVDSDPRVTEDQRTMYFSRSIGGGVSIQLYVTTR